MAALLHIPEYITALRMLLSACSIVLYASGRRAMAGVLIFIILILYLATARLALRFDMITSGGLLAIRIMDGLSYIAFLVVLGIGDNRLHTLFILMVLSELLSWLLKYFMRYHNVQDRERDPDNWGAPSLRYAAIAAYMVWPTGGQAFVPALNIAAPAAMLLRLLLKWKSPVAGSRG